MKAIMARQHWSYNATNQYLQMSMLNPHDNIIATNLWAKPKSYAYIKNNDICKNIA